MKVLITGSTGLIGGRVKEILSEDGYSAISFIGDVTKVSDWKESLKSSPDAIIHAAGVRTETQKDIKVNAESLDHLYNALKNTIKKPKTLILLSSQAVYFGKTSPLTEDMQLNPRNIYAKSKLIAEKKAFDLADKYDIRLVVLRLSTAIGPGIRLGNRMSGPLAIWTKNAKEGNALEIFQDGLQTRDYIHVYDVVSAIKLSLDRKKIKGIFNVGGGKRITLLKLATWIKEKTHSKSNLIIKGGKPRQSDPRDLFSDTSKLKSFGWKIKKTAREAVTEYVDSIKN